MTEQQHLITPPPKLVRQWNTEAASANMADERYIANAAARWGADAELEACCGFIGCEHSVVWSDKLRSARRPKSPSLKEQALDAWDRLRNEAWCEEIDHDLDFVRRALERLDEGVTSQ